MGVRGHRIVLRGEGTPVPPSDGTARSQEEIELALMKHFRFQSNIIAFNVHGVGRKLPLAHEADMLVVSTSGYLTEVEIKRSLNDFLADFKKPHLHDGRGLLKEFWFCVPVGIKDRVVEKLRQECFVPTGLILYDEELRLRTIRIVRTIGVSAGAYEPESSVHKATGDAVVISLPGDRSPVIPADSGAAPLFLEQILEIARLGAMRQYHWREKYIAMENKQKEMDTPEKRVAIKLARLETKITELGVLVKTYRERLFEATGETIDEKEVLYD